MFAVTCSTCDCVTIAIKLGPYVYIYVYIVYMYFIYIFTRLLISIDGVVVVAVVGLPGAALGCRELFAKIIYGKLLIVDMGAPELKLKPLSALNA